MAEFEERLRDALRTGAGGVVPDPSTWQRVQARIRRRRIVGWAVPATAAAAVAALAVFVLPGLLPGDGGVELTPADTDAEQAAEPTEAEPFAEEAPLPQSPVVEELEDRVAAVVWADGESVVGQTPSGQSLAASRHVGGWGLAVAPGSNAQEYALGVGTLDDDGGCAGETLLVQRTGSTSRSGEESLGDCVSPPRFSPDGEHVARVVRDGDEQRLDVRPFDVGGAGAPTETLALEGADAAVQVVAWLHAEGVPREEGAEELVLLERGEEASHWWFLPVANDDGEPALPEGDEVQRTPATDESGGVIVAAAGSASEPSDRSRIVAVAAEEGSVRLVSFDDEGRQLGSDLPDSLVDAARRAWVFAEGDDVLVGDGTGSVWHVALDDDDPAAVELDVDWTSAGLLPAEGAVVDEPEDDPVDDRQQVTAYFVRSSDGGLTVEPATVTLDTPTVGVARVAMEAVVAGGADGLDTLAPQGTQVLGATVDDDVLRLDLSGEVRDGDGSAEREEVFAQQLAHTAAQFEEVDAVLLLVQGAEVDALWGNLDWSEPIEPDELALSPIVIEDAAIEEGRLQVAGAATTYEGTVELVLVGPEGQVKEEAFATAECGAPCRGEWSHTFQAPARTAGTWEVTAGEPDVTDEGPRPFSTTVQVPLD